MIGSFILYFTVFIVSSVACRQYEKIDDRNSFSDYKSIKGTKIYFYSDDWLRIVWMLLILVPPIFITTFRGMEIGTDTANYASIYDFNKQYNFFEYLKIYGLWGHDYEIGYQQILHYSYVLNGGYNLVKAICGFLIVFFAWRGSLYYHRQFQINSGLCMFFFYLLEFTYGLNGVRYGIALSLFFYSFQFVIDKKLVKYLICCFLMMTFHSAMAVAVAFYLVNFTGYKILRKYWKYIAIIVAVIAVALLRPMVSYVIPSLGRYFLRFGMYEVGTSESYGLGIFLIFFLFLIPLIRWTVYVQADVRWGAILIAILTFIPFRFMGYFSQWLIRLSRMPEILFCVLYCGTAIIPIKPSEKAFWRIYTTVLLVVYYIVIVIVQNSGEVYPYVFDFTNHI